MFQEPHHEGTQENKAFGAGHKAKCLIGNDVRLCRQVRERHPKEQEAAQDIEFDETARAAWGWHRTVRLFDEKTRALSARVTAETDYTLAFGGASSRALQSELKPFRP